MNKWLACALVVATSGCPDIKTDGDENGTAPLVEFDPANKIIPFPNNLLLDRTTGKVALPASCNESATAKALREGTLNQLDGFGTFKPAMSIGVTAPLDMATATGNVVLYKRASGMTPVDPAAANAIPVVVLPGTSIRYDAACTTPTPVDTITVVPLVPLDQKSTYTVAIKTGVAAAGGAAYGPSLTWSLVRQAENPVTVDASGNVVSDRTPLDPSTDAGRASLLGIDLLWKAHAPAMAFLKAKGLEPADVLLAWEFNTQTTTAPLDPTVTGSPASTPTALPLLGNASQSTAAAARTAPYDQCIIDDVPTRLTDTECYLRVTLGKGNYAVGKATCAQIGCAAIGDVLGSLLISKQYMTDQPNPYQGTGTMPVPGQWTDPSAPTVVHNTTNPNPLLNDPQTKIGALVLTPVTSPPAEGYPTVVFQHGLGQSKTSAFAIAGRLAAAGFATVAIDAVYHDSRAVRVSNTIHTDPAKSCGNVTGPGQRPDLGPSPVTHPFCYAKIFSSDLGATRDGFRQSVLDQQQLITSLAACGTTSCGALKVDPTKIMYLGQSLGGIFGSSTTGLAPIKAAVLNVSGVGWVDILENTQTLSFQCPIVDALIDAGQLMGAKFDPVAMTGLCTGPEWKSQPGWKQFSVIGRWVLDPADPANFASKLAPKKFLIQRVAGDKVVPNVATDTEGALVGLTSMDATCGTPTGPGPTFTASPAITTSPATNKLVNYPTVAPGTSGCLGGNTYDHGALLRPATSASGNPCNPGTGADCDGAFATGQMQTDAITYLFLNR